MLSTDVYNYLAEQEEQNIGSYFVYWIHRPQYTNAEMSGYVGITKNLTSRIKDHFSGRTNSHLTSAIQKYDDINVRVLYVVDTEHEAKIVEESLRPSDDIGWNIVRGGGIPPSSKGTVKSEEHKDKYSRGEANPFYGKKHTPETRKLLSEKMKHNHPFYGKKRDSHSKVMSQKKHVTNGSVSKMMPIDEIEKFLEENPQWKLGRAKFKEGSSKNYSAAKKGTKFSEEHKDKLRKSSSTINKGKVVINNGDNNKFIEKKLLSEYLSSGWTKGMLRKNGV
jgi:predicted GIY-YIG superfamily endonuclease